jgi:hypothetical protein
VCRFFCCRYFSLFKLLFCFVIPVVVPPLLWGEGWYISAMGIGIVRYVFLLNAAWSVNSLAHIWGAKPYDRWVPPSALCSWLQISARSDELRNYKSAKLFLFLQSNAASYNMKYIYAEVYVFRHLFHALCIYNTHKLGSMSFM